MKLGTPAEVSYSGADHSSIKSVRLTELGTHLCFRLRRGRRRWYPEFYPGSPSLSLKEGDRMKIFVTAAVLSLALVSSATQFPDAPTGFDSKTNGMVDESTHQADQAKFEEV